jgi:DNA-directed RNA polymerase specialized sigma24 family protein
VVEVLSQNANRANSLEEKQALFNYMEQNKELFKNPIVRGFLEDLAHVSLLARNLVSPSIENKNQLENAFRRHFFRIRFTKYLCSLIRFCDIDYHRKRTKEEQRNPLVFDTPIDQDGEATLGELLYSISNAIEEEIPARDPELFQQTMVDETLFFAFNRLTDKQKLVITLAYSSCALDTEIATLLRISQQAITKTRVAALRKMKKYIVNPTHLPSGKWSQGVS